MENLVNYGEFIMAAFALLSLIVGSWINVRIQLARLERDYLALRERMSRLDSDVKSNRQEGHEHDDKLWVAISNIDSKLNQVLIALSTKHSE